MTWPGFQPLICLCIASGGAVTTIWLTGRHKMTVPQSCSSTSAAWLPALAAARPPAAAASCSDAQADRADRAVVQLSAPVPSSSAVAGMLLQAFVDSTAPQARAREAHPLPRSLEISVVGGAPPAAAAQAAAAPAAPEQQSQQQSQQQAAPLVVQFAATDEGADMQQVEQAARLFEVRAFGAHGYRRSAPPLHCCMCATGAHPCCLLPAPMRVHLRVQAYWSMHTKAAKSDLHCRMRRRLAALGQQLALQRFDSRT